VGRPFDVSIALRAGTVRRTQRGDGFTEGVRKPG
jgi:hypothetical protein